MFDGQGIAILKKELEKAKLESSRTKSEGEERRLALILYSRSSRTTLESSSL